MATVASRSYDDPCGIARALDVVGERWALLVVRELMLGPKRFVDLRAGLGKLSANVLGQRLRQLEEAGVVRRRTLAPPAGSRVYELTERGRGLEPVLLALGRWGTAVPFPPAAGDLGIDAMMMALPTVFDPARAAGLAVAVDIVLEGDRFRVSVRDGALDVTRPGDQAGNSDATIETDTATLTELLWRGMKVRDAERSGDLSLEGNRRTVNRLLTLFALPAS